ncbi:RibD family protein [Aetokthonos hydrillicola Thurmond2011]|jgi:5-amino-6-(5-phosphoribosylamino)uracil reductase|uniref:RibD family protein n=1 Tax=Aetokthonos hydrillicola Thurmond2011 TaxID=2712845 RepID=A0AAP5IA32_9CYAN|nr:RibD family protein [Aetokthonos hydrillicola]MBO3462478.1 RibD family protein [Aetokthonos hydrillicola CCALA 1050]MBW4588688.1 RibD family protein [Aetokthonos hydrillicola CCALA 1050]MDR9895978.1 RibD family protein [Aetokthonos hydrillicola Thurmond2011]
MMQHRPHTTVVLAMSADGKIANVTRAPARFGSKVDLAHLEKQIAAADAVLFGAGTLRAYGTTLTVSNPKLLQHRRQVGKPLQPVHIVITHSANLNPEIKFFQQPINRWLLTTKAGALFWQARQKKNPPQEGSSLPSQNFQEEFEHILVFETPTGTIDIQATLQHLSTLGITRLAVLGGGSLVASMVELDLIDEFWLTVCPLILGGSTAPTPVEGKGFLPDFAPRLELLEVQTVDQEVFLHYRVQRPAY